MNAKARLVEYCLVTGFVWLFYAMLLPIYFYFVFDWGWNEVFRWWITGTPVEFLVAYPLGKILWKLQKPIEQIVRRVDGGVSK